MKFKTSFAGALLTLLALQPASAIITVTFNRAFAGGVSEGFADSSGTVSTGLVYGIIIDSTANGILTQYDPNFSLDQGSLLSLASGGNATDDSLFLSAGLSDSYLTSDTSGFAEDGTFAVTGGPGAVSGLGDIPDSAAGLNFALIWFDSTQSVGNNVEEDTRYGILTDPSFVIPGAGQTATLDEPFIGDDPVRPATFGAFAVPEPSGVALLGLGSLGLLLRRKRS